MEQADILRMLEDLRQEGLHNVMFRAAGVGLLFYEGPPGPLALTDDSWKGYLVVKRYHPTFESAVHTEWMARCQVGGSDSESEGK